MWGKKKKEIALPSLADLCWNSTEGMVLMEHQREEVAEFRSWRSYGATFAVSIQPHETGA